MDQLNDVVVFVSVVRDGSFTRAAERLDISRSVASKYVTRLEDRLGARLLNRTTRRTSLTEAGRIFYEGARAGLDGISQAESDVSILQGHVGGTLRVNAPMSFGVLHVAPMLAGFIAENPDLRVDLNLTDHVEDVVEAGYDISIRIAEMPDSSLIARRIATCRHVIVASKDYLKLNRQPKHPSELVEHSILSYSLQRSKDNWKFRTPGGEELFIPIASRLEISNSLAIRSAVIDGLGIARMPTFVVGEDIRAGRLVQLVPDFETMETAVYLVYSHRKHQSPKVRAFVDYFASRVTGAPYWDQR